MRERRKAPRFGFGQEGMLHPPGGGVGTKAVVNVISTLGCAVECEKSPAVGKRCELYFDSPSGQIGVEAQAVSKGFLARTGLKFLSVDKDTLKRLGDLCTTLEAQPAGSAGPESSRPAGPAKSTQSASGKAASLPSPWAAPKPAAAPEKKFERRRVPRYVSELRASVTNGSSTSRVSLITLSVLGCCLEGQELPAPGSTCEVKTDWEGRPLRLQGQVIWGKNRQAGIKFLSLETETERLLRQVCAGLRLQPLAPLPSEPQ